MNPRYKMLSMFAACMIGTFVVTSAYQSNEIDFITALVSGVVIGIAVGVLHAIFLPDTKEDSDVK